MNKSSQFEPETILESPGVGDQPGGSEGSADSARLDRITESELEAIRSLHRIFVRNLSPSLSAYLHQLHENFVRSLSASLSAYLHTPVIATLTALEQMSFATFLAALPQPACLAFMKLHPNGGSAVLQLSPSLAFTFVEAMLGGGVRSPSSLQRKVTEIEKTLLQNLIRIFVRDLKEAWKPVAEVDFVVESLATEPPMSQPLAPAEAVILVTAELTLGPSAGTLQLVLPFAFIQRLQNKLEQMRQVRTVEPTPGDQVRVAQLIQDVNVVVEAHLDSVSVPASRLLAIDVGEVLELNYSLHRKVIADLNGIAKFSGEIVRVGDRLAFEVVAPIQEQKASGAAS